MIFDSKNKYKLEIAQKLFDELISKEAVIEIREKKIRSLDKNALMWVWLTCIQIESGLDKYETHFLYRCTFLRRDEDYILKIMKKEVWLKVKKFIDEFQYFAGLNTIVDLISKSTTEITDEEFSNYLKDIQQHARVNLNVILLSKKDKNFKEFYKEYGFR